MRLSVIIPFFNEQRFIIDCARSVAEAASRVESCRILFVDARSQDASAKRLRDAFPDLEILTAPSRNPYAARNFAARHSDGDILAFTDGACRVSPDWLGEAAAAVNSGTAFATGPVLPAPGASALLTAAHCYENFRMAEICGASGPEIPYAYTNNLAVRADVFRERQGFDETKFRGGDSEFVRRVIRGGAGGAFAYRPGMKITHLEMSGPSRWLKKKFLYGRSATAGPTPVSAKALGHMFPRQPHLLPPLIALLVLGRLGYKAGRLWRAAGGA